VFLLFFFIDETLLRIFPFERATRKEQTAIRTDRQIQTCDAPKNQRQSAKYLSKQSKFRRKLQNLVDPSERSSQKRRKSKSKNSANVSVLKKKQFQISFAPNKLFLPVGELMIPSLKHSTAYLKERNRRRKNKNKKIQK
jgi:hypothetical protein